EYEKLFFNEVNNKEKPFPFYDARYIFSENLKTLHYVDNIHYNDEAADALANYIVNIIVNK
ncbi:SGNH/GDSL hydrolase family protein, partial [bacterium]|nr:SGNH/GDSL hydrolase family protein [bacterium]